MKSALALALVFLSSSAIASHGIVHQHPHTELTTHEARKSSDNNWHQISSGRASFTQYNGCQNPSCGIRMGGYTAAVNIFSFGANSGAGDACGRCFKITRTHDPYSPSEVVTPHSIVVRVTDMCPLSKRGTPGWCDQKTSNPLNQWKMPMHFDLCEDNGTGTAFFPPKIGAMLGTYEEVQCEGNWKADEHAKGRRLWNGSCMANNRTRPTTPFWPGVGCGNWGTPP